MSYQTNKDMNKSEKSPFKSLLMTEVVEVEEDVELQEPTKESFARPIKSNGSYLMGVSLFFLVFSIFGYTTSHLLLEWVIDGDRMRFVYAALEPLILVVALFFSLSLATYVFQLFGPITGLRQNSRFFSAKKPNLNQVSDFAQNPEIRCRTVFIFQHPKLLTSCTDPCNCIELIIESKY
jgi:hypothetical protein